MGVQGLTFSHAAQPHLPENEREVRVQRYFSAFPKTLGNRLHLTKPDKTVERYMYDMSNTKSELANQMMGALQEASDKGPLMHHDRYDGYVPPTKTAAYRYGEKLAILSPGRLSALGAGLGFGAGVVHGRYKDDPTNSAEHHLGTSLAHGLAGAALGGGLGFGASKLFQRYRPDLVARSASVPFEGNIWAADPDKVLAGGSIGPADRLAPLKQKVNDAYDLWKHPAVGAASGALTGYGAADYVANKFDDWRFEQYAAQKAEANNPDVRNAGRLEAHMLRRHMGPYQSSLDSTKLVTPQR